MVHWYHSIFTAYGFWLPNDPRGSWSTFVGSWELFKFGGATKTTTRRSLAREPHDVQVRKDAKQAMRYPPIKFDDRCRKAIANGIERACAESDITLLACAIGHDHVHVVSVRHAKRIERVVGQFKGRATQEMKSEGCHPLEHFADDEGDTPTPWSERSWSVYIDNPRQLHLAINYVERHPAKERLRDQQWRFVRKLQ